MLSILLSIFIALSTGLNIPEQNFVHQRINAEYPTTFSRDIGSPNSISEQHFNFNTARQIHSNDLANQAIHGVVGHQPSSVYGQVNKNVEQVTVVKNEHSSISSHSMHQSRNVGVVQQIGMEYENRPYY